MKAIHWFRKGLRLNDNPALLEACERSGITYPIFILDPHFINPDVVGVNRFNFLLESLTDLDANLRSLGSRLYLLKGNPCDIFPVLFDKLNVNLLTYEYDSEPYAIVRDRCIDNIAHKMNVEVTAYASHTLHDLKNYVSHHKTDGDMKSTYSAFTSLFSALGPPRTPASRPSTINSNPHFNADDDNCLAYLIEEGLLYTNVPSLSELGYPPVDHPLLYPGGETEGLKRLHNTIVTRPNWVRTFSKPDTSPTAFLDGPSTTVLSPYLKFGCVSACHVLNALENCVAAGNAKIPSTSPPVSLKGQLLWREFFYYSAFCCGASFSSMEGNTRIKQIPWERSSDKIAAWKEGRTGYPFIDAIMTQLRKEGWIHHLARHAAACFLTRGDLWQHWEEGVKVFDLYLLDADYALNNANWQWLSCSNFFYQYFRVYSPVAFGKKYDKNGDYIRRYLPQLKNMPAKYIYEPWKAPLEVQRNSGCILGKDYPFRIVDHDAARKENIHRMQLAYDNNGSKAFQTIKKIKKRKFEE